MAVCVIGHLHNSFGDPMFCIYLSKLVEHVASATKTVW